MQETTIVKANGKAVPEAQKGPAAWEIEDAVAKILSTVSPAFKKIDGRALRLVPKNMLYPAIIALFRKATQADVSARYLSNIAGKLTRDLYNLKPDHEQFRDTPKEVLSILEAERLKALNPVKEPALTAAEEPEPGTKPETAPEPVAEQGPEQKN